jgi:hypothetical protein
VSIQPEDFLAQGPSAFLDQPSFLESGPQVPAQPVDDHPDYLKIGVGIAAALVVLRLLMKHEFSTAELLTDKEIADAAARIYKRIVPAWLQAAVPAVLAAYQLGSTQQLTYSDMERLATAYAADLGDYVHQTSTQALIEGFNAQVNSGWSADLAWKRSQEAYGLDSRQMQSYIKGLVSRDKADYVTDPIPPASRMFVDRAFLHRADRLGQTEVYKASRVGKNMVWMVMESTGQLPPGVMKKWVTAEDERVCAVCGPLDKVTIPLDERFETLGGEMFWAPVVHPNCRCDLELVYPDLGNDVVKAMRTEAGEWDERNRNEDGEFAATESRKAKVTRVHARTRVKVRESQGTAEADALAALSALSDLDKLADTDSAALAALTSDVLGVQQAAKQQTSDAEALALLSGVKGREAGVTVVQHHERPNTGGEGVHSTDAWAPAPDVLLSALKLDLPPTNGDIVDLRGVYRDDVSVHGLEGFSTLAADDVVDITDNPGLVRAVESAMGFDAMSALADQRAQDREDGMGTSISSYGAIDAALDIYTDPVVGQAAESFAGKEKPYLTHLAARTLNSSLAAQEAAGDDLASERWMKTATASEIAIEMTAAVNNERANSLGTEWQSAANQARSMGTLDPDDISTGRFGMDEGSSRAMVPVIFRFKGWWGTDHGPDDVMGGEPFTPNVAEIEGSYAVAGHEYLPLSNFVPDVGMSDQVLVIDLELQDAP